MRHLLFLALFACLVAVGCKSGDSAPKGSNTGDGGKQAKNDPPSKPFSGESKRLDLSIEPSPLTLKQGEKKKWQINIRRSGGYDKEFTIMVIPGEGFKLPEEIKVPASKEKDQVVEVEVMADAAAKEGDIQLVANAPGFEDPKAAMVKVTIAK